MCKPLILFLLYISLHHTYYLTLLPCAVESHPTPGDSRGSSSPSGSISGVSSHVADRRSARIPPNSGLMFSMTHMFDFLSIHDTFSRPTLLQHHNSKASIVLLSCFLIYQVSVPYRTSGNTKTLTSFTFVTSVTPLRVFSYSVFETSYHHVKYGTLHDSSCGCR